jgi:hypothetical protein
MRRFKWTVEIEVDETWVMGGFNLTEAKVVDMLQNTLPFAYSTEVGARIIKAPTKQEIRKAQGYNFL